MCSRDSPLESLFIVIEGEAKVVYNENDE